MTSATPQPNPTEALLTMLNLTPLASTGQEELFSAQTLTDESPRIFGGQVLAQALIAASRTVEDKQAHSLHAYFLRPGQVEAPLSYGVEVLNEGRSFATRRVQAYQPEAPIFSAIVSFQAQAAGPDHSASMPQGLPEPESLPQASDILGSLDIPLAQKVAYTRPIDIRHISAPLYLGPDRQASAQNLVWFKTFGPLPDDPALHQAALAYASDYTQIEPLLRRHGQSWVSPGMKVASLDHTIWFHRPARADDWLLLVQDSPSAQGARGLSLGQIFSRDGVHVATVAQEAMFRLPDYR